MNGPGWNIDLFDDEKGELATKRLRKFFEEKCWGIMGYEGKCILLAIQWIYVGFV